MRNESRSGDDNAAQRCPAELAPTPATTAWPEDAAPPGVDCASLGMAGHGRLVWGEGNPRAPVMIVLDNPGARENASGQPYVCGTRQTLHAAVAEAGLNTTDLYLTFLVRCRPRKAYDRDTARQIGLRLLVDQLENHRPKVLVLLGDVVTKSVLGDPDASVRSLRNSTTSVFGIPTAVGYHPLAARRRPNLYPLLVEDMERSRALLDAVVGQKN